MPNYLLTVIFDIAVYENNGTVLDSNVLVLTIVQSSILSRESVTILHRVYLYTKIFVSYIFDFVFNWLVKQTV